MALKITLLFESVFSFVFVGLCRLHDGFGWLCLDHHDLSENLPLACFGGWLPTRLQHAETRNGKFASGLHLLGCNLCQTLKRLLARRGLELGRLGQSCCDARLRHGCSGLGLHRCLHGLGSHCAESLRVMVAT